MTVSKKNNLCVPSLTIAIAGLLLSACTSALPVAQVNIDESQVVTHAVSPGLFGFTIDWYWFQQGHFRMGNVRNETIKYLQPFEGALYRFSGGNAYPWKNAVGDIASRKRIQTPYHGAQYPEFGPSEFLKLMTQLKSDSVILLDVARKDDPKLTVSDTNTYALDYIDWLAKQDGICFSVGSCQIKYFELGNEVDTELKWSASSYAARVLPIIKSAKQKYPNIRFAITGKTAPWDGQADSTGQNYSKVLALHTAPQIEAVTYHPYYDGRSIPDMHKFALSNLGPFIMANPKVKTLITEHGRWPSKPVVGAWEDNWYQASGSGGALSTADFVLSLFNSKIVAGAMWHTIGVDGPWKLFHLDRARDKIYPSAVYWALLTLRNGFLSDTVKTQPELLTGGGYSGGYRTRLQAMKSQNGQLSLIGVNREDSFPIQLNFKNIDLTNRKYTIYTFSSDSLGSENTDLQPDQFIMETNKGVFLNKFPVIDLPSRSVFSIVLE